MDRRGDATMALAVTLSLHPTQAVPTPKGGNLDKHEIDCCSLSPSLPPSLRSAAPLHSTNSNSFHTGRLRRPRLDSPPNTKNDHPSQVFFSDFPGVQDGLPLRAGIVCPIMPTTSSTRALIEGRSSRCAQVFLHRPRLRL